MRRANGHKRHEIEDDPAAMVFHVADELHHTGRCATSTVDQLRDALAKFVDGRMSRPAAVPVPLDDFNAAVRLLTLAYRAHLRDGWEDGPTMDEVTKEIQVFLRDHGADPNEAPEAPAAGD